MYNIVKNVSKNHVVVTLYNGQKVRLNPGQSADMGATLTPQIHQLITRGTLKLESSFAEEIKERLDRIEKALGKMKEALKSEKPAKTTKKSKKASEKKTEEKKSEKDN